MKQPTFYLILVFLLVVLVQCNSSTASDEEEIGIDTIGLIEGLQNITNDGTKLDNDTNEIILFANMDRFIRSKENKSVLRGINDVLMDAILIKYIQNKHLDPNRSSEEATDSISVNLIKNEFSFVRKSLSKLTMYDVLLQRDENIEDSYKKVKVYDRYFVKGNFKITEVKLDIATIEITGKIQQADPITYYYYGEEMLAQDNVFKDQLEVDLMEAFNDLGKMKNLTHKDLQVINSKRLSFVRNQFFARKGYIFKTDKMKNYFGNKEWYTPKYEDVSDSLSEIEKYNIELIKQLEE
jgi:hypothetical protein